MADDLELKFLESAHPGVLDRDNVVSAVNRVFADQLALLRDVTNYGSTLIPRCFSSSSRGLKDVVVIALLRQVVAMLDGTEILLSKGAAYAAGLQTRALFEASVYLQWMLQNDAERKANYYYVHNIRRQRLWAQRTQAGSPEATSFSVAVPDLPSFQDPETVARAKAQIAEIDRVLAQPVFQPMNKAFEQRRRPDGSDVEWYRPLGFRSIGAVMEDVGKTAEYSVFYASLSAAMHSSDYLKHFKLGNGKVTFEPIRHPQEFVWLFRFSIATAFHTFRQVLHQYRPGEIEVLNRKYRENWRKAYMEVPSVKYEVTSS